MKKKYILKNVARKFEKNFGIETNKQICKTNFDFRNNIKWIFFRSLVYFLKGIASSALLPIIIGYIVLSNAIIYN